jgi:hypothetical protein
MALFATPTPRTKSAKRHPAGLFEASRELTAGTAADSAAAMTSPLMLQSCCVACVAECFVVRLRTHIGARRHIDSRMGANIKG